VFASEEITEPDAIIFNSPIVTNVDCFGDCDGSISINTLGGTIPYSFLWDDPNNQTTTLANNLCDGTYTFTLTDGNNCQKTYIDSIVEPELLLIVFDTIIQSSCKGTFDGEIQLTVSGGVPTYIIDWIGSNGQIFNTEDIIGALPMEYYLTVTDLNGCIAQDTAIIDTATIVLVDAGLDTVLCNLDEILLLATSNQPTADYTWYDILNTEISDTNTYLADSLIAGVYEFVAHASFDNCDDFDTVIITINERLVLDAGPDLEVRETGTDIIGGNPTTTETGQLTWTPSIYLNDTTIQNPQVSFPIEDTWYYVKLIDSLGCEAIDSMFVDVIPPLIVPEGISPNNDGKNDAWVIDFTEDFPDIEVSVYNRWGELLFYDNNGYLIPWDGKHKGNTLPVGTYYYVIELNSELFPEPFVGPLTILR
jgi:gliding motility-associated-like protein